MILSENKKLDGDSLLTCSRKSDHSGYQDLNELMQVNKANLSEYLNLKIEQFHRSQKQKLNLDSSGDISDILRNNPGIFRDIDAFARKQSRLVDSHFCRLKDCEFKIIGHENYFQDENERLGMLLKSKNLKPKNISSNILITKTSFYFL